MNMRNDRILIYVARDPENFSDFARPLLNLFSIFFKNRINLGKKKWPFCQMHNRN